MSGNGRKAVAAAVLMLAVATASTPAAGNSPLDGLKMGAPLETVRAYLEERCVSTELVASESPRYPLAAVSEATLLCRAFGGGPLSFDKAAFLVADKALAQVEAHGVDTGTAKDILGEPDGAYLGMNHYDGGRIWLDTENQRLFWLSNDARHPNLFAWSNPLLGDPGALQVDDSTRLPALVDFSASLEQLLPSFRQYCPQIIVHEDERVWLPNKPVKQVQIDCFGIPFAGFPRKFEVVFGDGKLQVIWVLTGKQEESRVREYLARDWGQPDHVNDSWEVYANGRISLYKDKPEFLILSDEMIPLYREMQGVE